MNSTGERKSTLVFHHDSLGELRRQLLAAAPREAAAFLLASSSDVGGGARRLIVTNVIHLGSNDYAHQSEWSVELVPRILADVTKLARQQSASLLLVHTHPTSDRVEPSDVDRDGERTWIPAVSRRVPGAAHGRVILGETAVCAALLSPDGNETELGVVEVGDLLVDHSDAGVLGTLGQSRNDRQIRAFGIEGQRRLEQLQVGIVGLGGTGSVVAQQLAYLGVGEITLIDPDIVEWSNLNRIVGSTPQDVGERKTRVAAALISRTLPSIIVNEIPADVRDSDIARKLLLCDLFFCCTDSDGSRAVLNQIAYQYCIPAIDLGVAIIATHGTISHISGRIQLLSPTQPCLVCGSLLDPEQVRRDLLSDEARTRDRYIAGSDVPQPAVISINSATASLAVTMMLGIVTAMPVASRHQRLRLETGIVSRVSVNAIPDCPVCSQHGVLGRGDSFQFPGRP
jgi:molybdopterin-synthase adenylyltransferase